MYPAQPVAAYPQPVAIAPVVQQVVVAPAPVIPLFIVDTQRKATQQPGVLVYSAKFNSLKLQCLYCLLTCPFCCTTCNNTDEMSRLTHLDVYTNYVSFASPDGCWHLCDACCGHTTVAVSRYFDHHTFNRAVTSDGLCYGRAYLCCACQGSFGEQITFMNGCFSDCCKPSGLAHFTSCCNCCGVSETIFGLKEEEGRKLAGIINEQVSIFRANPGMYPLDPLVANGTAASTMF